MKTIYIVSGMINNSSTTKVEMFRFSSMNLKSAQKELKTDKINSIEYWKWFNSVEEAEQYLQEL